MPVKKKVGAATASPEVALEFLIAGEQTLLLAEQSTDRAELAQLLAKFEECLAAATRATGPMVLRDHIRTTRNLAQNIANALKAGRIVDLPIGMRSDVKFWLDADIRKARAAASRAAAQKLPWPRSLEKSATAVCHPASTVRLAVAALAVDARQRRAAGDAAGAAYASRTAKALKRVADGQSWVDAFRLDDADR
jgi:hypothetical protein